MEPNQKIDHRIASFVAKRYAFQSRRSFVHRLSVGFFGLLGVSIGMRVPLFQVTPARADFTHTIPTPWYWCGLDGNECGAGGNCTGSVAGATGGAKWIQCCKNDTPTGCNLWHCCEYTDVCQTTPFIPVGCQGQGTGRTRAWCAASFDEYPYFVCTVITCGSTGYEDGGNCRTDACVNHMGVSPYVCPAEGGP